MSLTPRELCVLNLLAGSLTAGAIGRQLGISTRTVNKHVENLYRKMGTSDRLAAVLHAQAVGLLSPPRPSDTSRTAGHPDMLEDAVRTAS